MSWRREGGTGVQGTEGCLDLPLAVDTTLTTTTTITTQFGTPAFLPSTLVAPGWVAAISGEASQPIVDLFALLSKPQCGMRVMHACGATTVGGCINDSNESIPDRNG